MNWSWIPATPGTPGNTPASTAEPRRYVVGRKAKSTSTPKPSRSVVGPSSGMMRYGPLSTPLSASVCPKSEWCSGNPNEVAGSANPATPIVELRVSRAVLTPASCHSHWSTSLAMIEGEFKLAKKRRSPRRAMPGTTRV